VIWSTRLHPVLLHEWTSSATQPKSQCECGNKEFGISGQDRPPPSSHFSVCSAARSINWSATREIVGRDLKGAQIGDGENIDFPAKLL
jgi:hypothetical protein